MRREFSAGGIVFRKNGEEIVWLVRYPHMSPGYVAEGGWSLPKGWIDEGESVEQAALREVAEEGGVEAKIVAKLPTLKIFYTDKRNDEKVMKFITYFVMEWVKDTPEKMDNETEKVNWANFEETYKLLMHSSERKLLKQATAEIKQPSSL